MRLSRIAKLLLAVLALGTATAHAIEPFTIRDIRVEGLQRTEAGTVFSYLPVRVGDRLDDEKSSQALKALFATGFFKDVRIEVQGDVMIVMVEERPAIAVVDISGTKDIEKDSLKKALRDNGLAEGRIFDRAVVERAEQEIKRQYLSRGRYAAQVTTTITPLERNRVGVSFVVAEGEIAKIRQINIVGTKEIREKDLLSELNLSAGNWVSWYTKNDQYSKAKLNADLETIRSYYLNRGYLEFNIESTQVSITPDKQDIFITINITEGKKYKITDVKLAGELLIPEAEVMKLIDIKPGDAYSGQKVADASKKIVDRLGAEGYAFANANAQPEINKEKAEAAFTFFIDPGRRVYVRRVNVGGNTRTKDVVIRRELRQMEGAYYDVEKLNESKKRLDRLDYFREVTIDTPPVAGTTDQVDVSVNITEKPTGAILAGIGFSSADKLSVSGSVSQQNFMGTGNAVSVQANSSKVNKTYSASYTNPYYTVDGVSRGFDAYFRTYDPDSQNLGDYRLRTVGAGVRFGYPLTNIDTLTFGLNPEHSNLRLGSTPPARFTNFVAAYGNSTNTLLGTVSWARDTRDSGLNPTEGGTQSLVLDSGVAGSLRYYRITYNHARYFTVFRDSVIALRGDAGIGRGTSGKPLPFYKNFYAGGLGTVRGFRQSSLGPKDSNGEYMGAEGRLVLNAEYLMPLPGFGRDKSIRWGGFVDGGNVFSQGAGFKFGDLRWSSGLMLDWTSPFGPLRFSYAFPMNKKAGDALQRFQFQVGNVF